MLTNRRSGAEPDKQLPPWLDPEAGLGLVPHLTVLARVLCVAIGTRDRALIDDLDQAETGFQGFSPSEDERAQIALGRCLGKSYEVPETFDRFKQLLVKSGVKDWDLFVDHVGRPYAREFGVEIAGFREKSEYRWVETKALPIPHELIKGRLPEGGLEMWDDLRVVRRSFGRTKNRSDSEIRDLWVAYYRQNWPLDWSRLDAPWDVIVERVEEFWQLPDSQW